MAASSSSLVRKLLADGLPRVLDELIRAAWHSYRDLGLNYVKDRSRSRDPVSQICHTRLVYLRNLGESGSGKPGEPQLVSLHE